MGYQIILFVCKGNSGRSQIAEAFFNTFSKNTKSISAGIEPDKEIHPWTIKVMEEVGIDVKKQKPKKLTENLLKKADKIIVMDSDLIEKIPKNFLIKTENWEIDKLLGKTFEEVKEIRDKISKKVKQYEKKISKKKFLSPSSID